ncbi:MAG: DM13 domain-containing protein [Pseudomonadota bacterium]|nr:DM13 domain-containing protein [Pseudomonadota bacterium]
MRRWIIGLVSHAAARAIGFALGVYLLPILTAPAGPERVALVEAAADARFTATFTRDLPGSDFLHWGWGTVGLSARRIVHDGRLAPGPDYKLYLVDTFVNGEFTFLQVKDRARLIGDVKSFDGFVLDVPAGVDVAAYTTDVVWCEAFSEFITAAQYR